MANNKVQLANGTVLIDLTADTVTPETLMQGVTAHDKSGNLIVGTATGGGGVLIKTNIIVPVSSFEEYSPVDEQEQNIFSSGFEYKATVPVSGITEEMTPQIIFDIKTVYDSDITILNQIQSYNGGFYIYSDNIPKQSIKILVAEFREGEYI